VPNDKPGQSLLGGYLACPVGAESGSKNLSPSRIGGVRLFIFVERHMKISLLKNVHIVWSFLGFKFEGQF
jgi:hypothetical protein